jgi:ribosomal protein S18 acetylase RimI-like enzyme
MTLREDRCRRGFDSAAYRELESRVRRWQQIQKIGLGVVATNSEVCAFWEKQGFRRTGEVKPWQLGRIESELILMGKGFLRQ